MRSNTACSARIASGRLHSTSGRTRKFGLGAHSPRLRMDSIVALVSTPAPRIAAISSALSMMPSVSKNPAASSTSCPGVRMVTVTGAPFRRISSGSSTASMSSTARTAPSCHSVTWVSTTLCAGGCIAAPFRPLFPELTFAQPAADCQY